MRRLLDLFSMHAYPTKLVFMNYLKYLKYATAVFGFFLFGHSFWGAVLGFIIGAFISFKLSGGLVGKLSGFGNVGGHSALKTERQTVFFETVFTLMGKLAKADGQVSAAEIQHVEVFMTSLKMSPENRKQAIAYFTTGKQEGFDIKPVIEAFNRANTDSRNLKQILMVYLVRIAIADGQIHAAESALLRDIALQLGYSEQNFAQLIAMLQGQDQFAGGQYQSGAGGASSNYTSPNALDAAYQALGVDKSASDAEVKKAYRRLIREYHPDKLTGQGLPEEMILEATERTKEIQAAYEMIKKQRK